MNTDLRSKIKEKEAFQNAAAREGLFRESLFYGLNECFAIEAESQ